MRKTKEERIIEHGDYILKELHKVYEEGIGIDEYYKLLGEYKKLFRRYTKTIKLSDNMGNTIMGKNDTLSDNLEYTIHKARTKLMDNVKEHRKTKEASATYLSRIREYEDALKESYTKNKKLEKKISQYIKSYGEIQNIFESNTLNPKDSIKDINPKELNNMNINQLLSLELTKDNKEFILTKLALNNFDNMIETIEENSSLSNFLSGIYRYLSNSLKKDDIIFHSKEEEFYIITRNKSTTIIRSLMQKINKKRKVLGFDIQFTIGITQYNKDLDTKELFLNRCEKTFEEAKTSNMLIAVK